MVGISRSRRITERGICCPVDVGGAGGVEESLLVDAVVVGNESLVGLANVVFDRNAKHSSP